MLNGREPQSSSILEEGTGMTSASGQPDKQSAIPPDEVEETLEEGDASPATSDAAETMDEAPSGENADETIISQSSHSLADTASKRGSTAGFTVTKDSDECDFPSEFGRYAIKKQLGRGAMGAVFLARDTQLNRDVALKVPTFSDKSPANMIERFYREARTAATLTHPNICPVYDVGQHDGTHFISMGYIEGRPLSEYIESGKKQPEQRAAAVVRKLALALQEAHEKGIVHRDLKPANIMIDQRSEPIVMDFGLARLTSNSEEAKLTREGTVMGSPAYMSPEQVEGKTLGPQCDVYSLGVVFYELLTGQTPFQGNVVSVIGQILAANPKPPTELRPDLSAECSAVCLKAMASQQSERFQSMAEYAQALGAFIKGDLQAIETFVELESSGDALSIEELKLKRASATSLIKKKQFKSAVSALETLAELKGNQAADVAAWAKQQLPRAQEHYEKSAKESKDLFRRAKKSMAGYDYERASQQLGQIPADLRNDTVSDLKAEADDLVKEVRRLSDDVDHAIRSGVYDDMLPSVERLLELKPQHRQANELYEKLYSNVREARPARKTPQRRKSRPGSKLDPRAIGGAVAAAVVLIGLLVFWPDNSSPTAGESFDDSGADIAQPDSGAKSGTTGSSAVAATPDGPPFDNSPLTDGPPGAGRPGRGPGGRPDDIFRRHDRNADAILTGEEIPPFFSDKIDRDSDGEVTFDELRKTMKELGAKAFLLPALEDDRRPGPRGPGPRGPRPRE
jgi:serine/threonine protein kinase